MFFDYIDKFFDMPDRNRKLLFFFFVGVPAGVGGEHDAEDGDKCGDQCWRLVGCLWVQPIAALDHGDGREGEEPDGEHRECARGGLVQELSLPV